MKRVYNELEIRARIGTKIFAESKGGILLCGINWGDGGSSTSIEVSKEPSFFSDTPQENYLFQRTICKWFGLWGHELGTVKGKVGPLERCITHTNWLAEGSKHADVVYTRKNLVACAEEEFLPLLEYFRPRLLIFFGVLLIEAFADKSLRQKIEDILGQMHCHQKPQWFKKTNGGRRFRVQRMRFKDCVVIGLPHPTPKASRLADQDVQQMLAVMSNAITESGVPSTCRPDGA
jgi:hypothetical protein